MEQLFVTVFSMLAVASPGPASAPAGICPDVTVKIDSAPDENAVVNICPCFAQGEVAMTILDTPAGNTPILAEMQILWMSFSGPQPDTLEAAITVYDMNQTGSANPNTFTPLCTVEQGCVLEGPVMVDGVINSFDVRPLNIELPENRFGIGIAISNDQTQGNPLFIPSVASDDDGHNNAGGVIRNWVLVNGTTWLSSQSLGVSGDWIIRAVVEVCDPPDPCPWDCGVAQGIVDVIDFFSLIAEWGLIGSDCDLGVGPPGVDVVDFFEVLAHWGPCP